MSNVLLKYYDIYRNKVKKIKDVRGIFENYYDKRINYIRDFVPKVFLDNFNKQYSKIFIYNNISVYVTDHSYERITKRLGDSTRKKYKVIVDIIDIIDMFRMAGYNLITNLPPGNRRHSITIRKKHYALDITEGKIKIVTMFRNKSKDRKSIIKYLSFIENKFNIAPISINIKNIKEIKQIFRTVNDYIFLINEGSNKLYYCWRNV